MHISWEQFIQFLFIFLVGILFFSKGGRDILLESSKRVFTAVTSKRFIVLMIATWFVKEEIAIDANWLWLAGFYIGIDTAQNHGVFSAFADFLKNKKPAKNEP